MKFLGALLLLGGVFWLIKKRDSENQGEKASAKQNTLNYQETSAAPVRVVPIIHSITA